MTKPALHWSAGILLGGLSMGACGPAVAEPISSESDPTTGMETSTGDDAATTSGPGTSVSVTSSSTTSGGGTASTGHGDTGSTGDTGSSSSSSDDELLVSRNNVYIEVSCPPDETGARIFAEVYVDEPLPEACVAPVEISADGGLLLISIQGWDGYSGRFEFTEDGPNRAALGISKGFLMGTGEVTVANRYEVETIDLALGDWGEGLLDFRLCPPRVPDPACD